MAESRKTVRQWVANKMGRLRPCTVTRVSATLYAVPELTDYTSDDERFVDSYLMLDATEPGDSQGQWRRITATNVSTGQVSINRAFSPEPGAGSPAWIYSLLNPDEWNQAINTALTPLTFKDRHELSLSEPPSDPSAPDTSREYALPHWVMTRGQVLDVRYRNQQNLRETPVPRWRVQEDLTGCTLVLLDTPPPPSQYTLIIEAIRYHDRLDADNWGTVAPRPLWQAAVEVAAIHLVVNKTGDRFRAQYRQNLAIAERALMNERARHQPTMTAREYVPDDDWAGPDIDPFFHSGSWT